ncbi:MAG: hypothetical protein ACRDOW_04575, partial [Nocardioidaceae bacterium]
FSSRQDDSPAMKAVAAMRNQFGGHAMKTDAPPTAGSVTPPTTADTASGAPAQSTAAESAGSGSGTEPAES